MDENGLGSIFVPDGWYPVRTKGDRMALQASTKGRIREVMELHLEGLRREMIETPKTSIDAVSVDTSGKG